MGLAAAAMTLLRPDRPWWLLITVVMVFQPNDALVHPRVLRRVVGTVTGVAAAMGLSYLMSVSVLVLAVPTTGIGMTNCVRPFRAA
ncbi:FUSC family protein [Streptomyces gamaensis]|uniref:FUSC family protein n=1 Tax=Streptomyces gamaensis TaxID=1763542 RepID=A0ABW0ZA50_9ACTN